MASLTETAITTRKIVRYSIYGIILLIIGRIFLGIGVSLFQAIFPAPPPAPTVQFGKLPSIPFHIKKDVPSLQYTIETPEGGLPNLSTQAKVYLMPQARPDLLELDQAKTKASTLGFTNPTKMSNTIYKFTSETASSTLEMNIVTGTFSIGFDLKADSSPLSSLPPTPDIAANTAKSFLSRGNILPDDLTGQVTQEFLKVQNGQLVSAVSLSEANLIKINLFRKDYDKLPSLTPNPNEGNVWFIISGNQDSNKQIVGVQYYYYPVDETQYSTYPIITASEALKNLEAGKGYIANVGANDTGKVTIRRVYLAYYDPDVEAQFYEPIIAFEGDNGFVAYVPAVTSSYYSQ